MLETHPDNAFIPPNTKYLILGSFPSILSKDNWFYSSKRSQFWPILKQVYSLPLADIGQQQVLFSDLGIAITDIIYQCERRRPSSLDSDLINIVYNLEQIASIFERYKINKVFFTSQFVYTKFVSNFKLIIEKYPTLKLVSLPSPSPGFAKLSLSQKVDKYKSLLPALA